MYGAARTTVTLVALCALVALAAAWGWKAATAPLPGKVDSPLCVDASVAKGAKVYPQQVTVSVYNASQRSGLAGRTMQALQDQGFARGEDGNAGSAKVARAAIWTDNPDSPAVRLLASHLGKGVQVQEHEGLGAGVTVIVGDKFKGVVTGARSVVSTESTEICSPPVE